MAATTSKEKLLIVDDAPPTLEVLQRNLVVHGFDVVSASGVAEAKQILSSTRVDLVITDLKMPGASGMELVQHVCQKLWDTEVLIISGYPPPESGPRVSEREPVEFLSKPFTQEELLAAVRRTLDRLRLRRMAYGKAAVPLAAPPGLFGTSDAAQHLFLAIGKASATSAPILVTGEPGTEREAVARAIHYSSFRASAPFVVVRCGGIPEGLKEMSLFGEAHRRPATHWPGLFLAAAGGTIYLDGICQLGLDLQRRVVRFLQDKEVQTASSSQSTLVDMRVIASSSCPLSRPVEAGKFLQDLYSLLSATTITIPPLRERHEDLEELVLLVAARSATACGRKPPRISPSAMELLKGYTWPGNLPEVEQVVQGLVLATDSSVIHAGALPAHLRASSALSLQGDLTLAAVEAAHIAMVLAQVNGNKSRAARILDINRKTLREKLKGHESPPDSG